jgi:hypothetical protein
LIDHSTQLAALWMTGRGSEQVTLPRRALTSVEFSQLADVPPEAEWFANIDNANTRRACRNDLKEFMTFAGIRSPTELRLIIRIKSERLTVKPCDAQRQLRICCFFVEAVRFRDPAYPVLPAIP